MLVEELDFGFIVRSEPGSEMQETFPLARTAAMTSYRLIAIEKMTLDGNVLLLIQ
jgi:hypothetical protein